MQRVVASCEPVHGELAMYGTRRALIGAILGGLLLAAPGRPVHAGTGRPMLWKTNGAPEVWVLGTCAVPAASAQGMPRGAGDALDTCAAFLTELPSSAADAARLEAQIKKLSALAPEVGGLRKLVDAELYMRVLAHVPDLPSLETREPWYIHGLVRRAYLAGVYPTQAGLLTRTLWDRATAKGLKTAGLDTVTEYLEAFDGLALADQVTWLRHTVDLYEKEKDAKVKRPARVVEAYLAGDVDRIQALWREGLPPGELGAKVASVLLEARVRRMVRRMTPRLERKPDEAVFLAVDATLLAGEHGVLAQLAAAGHVLERVD